MNSTRVPKWGIALFETNAGYLAHCVRVNEVLPPIPGDTIALPNDVRKTGQPSLVMGADVAMPPIRASDHVRLSMQIREVQPGIAAGLYRTQIASVILQLDNWFCRSIYLM